MPMQLIEQAIEPFLSGQQFSNGLKIQVPEAPVIGRIEALTTIIRGKSVIHFGFCDHLPLVAGKMSSGTWLHGILSDAASECVGLDIDDHAVRTLADEHNVSNGFTFDLFQDTLPSAVTAQKWDYVIMGEILEHVDNPVAFLDRMKTVFSACASRLIVTVPNAYDLTSQQFAQQNSECINSDHRYWFTPYTLTKVAHRSGLELEGLQMCDDTMKTTWRRRRKIQRQPILAETLVGTFRLQNQDRVAA